MKSASHQAMGYLLQETLEKEGIKLDCELFVLGNLLPDYLPELILSPHFTNKCQREIRLFTATLASSRAAGDAELPPEYSLRLGILCHYMTDYFTFAHSREFPQNLSRHSAYEQGLDDFFRAHYSADECLLASESGWRADSARDVAQSLFSLRRQYKTAERAYETDLQYAFTACLLAARELVRLSAQGRQGVRRRRFVSPFAAEKYAFSGVCRRRIVPRRAWCPAAA